MHTEQSEYPVKKIVEKGTLDTPTTQIHDHSHKVELNDVFSLYLKCVYYYYHRFDDYKLEKKTKRAIKFGENGEIENTGYTQRRQTEQKRNTICVGEHHAQTNTNNVNNI